MTDSTPLLPERAYDLPEYSRFSVAMCRVRIDKLAGRKLTSAEQHERTTETLAAYEALMAALHAKPDPVPHVKREGTIYVIAAGEFVKIGFTDGKPQDRLRMLQTGSPMKLSVVAQMSGTMREERALHRRFAAQRAEGEWFRREGAVAEWIKGGCL